MKRNKVLVTGGSGLIGSKFPDDTDSHIFIKVGSKDFDLTKESECQKMFDNILMEIDPTIAAVSVMQILLVSIVLFLIGRFGRGLGSAAR